MVTKPTPEQIQKRYRNEAYKARRLKDKGMSNRAIAKEMKLSPNTIARRLAMPPGLEERFIDILEKKMRESREALIYSIIAEPEYAELFGAEEHGIRVEDIDWDVKLVTTDGSPEFTLTSGFTARKIQTEELEDDAKPLSRTKDAES